MDVQPQTLSYHSDTQVQKASVDFQSYLQDQQEQFAKETTFCEAYSRSINTSPALGLTEDITPWNSPEVYPQATGSTDQVPQQNNNDNAPQAASTFNYDSIMAETPCSTAKS